MPLTIITVPCREDNYAYLLRDDDSGEVALVDAPSAAPIIAELSEQGWGLDHILLTHHHADHVDGVPELASRYGARVVGAAADQHRLPPLDLAVNEGDTVHVGAVELGVLDVSGHTVGHIAFVSEKDRAAFTADSLMALGCGRVFEGTFDQMWASLSKLARLDPKTRIYSGHEYTAANAKFAVTIEPENAKLSARVARISEIRAKGEPTVPVPLDIELATNPFLRAGAPEVKAALGMDGASDAEVFAEIRRRKDAF